MNAKPWESGDKLVISGSSGDGKRLFIESSANDGWRDLRIEIDTDDVDSGVAKGWAEELIRRYNSFAKGGAK